MKKNLHPTVRQVVFKDVSSDFSFLGRSTMDSKETIKLEDGKSYPLIKLEVSSASHPLFTGKQRVPDTEGRIDRFKKKYGTNQSRATGR
jgi:large subunit ribosomal protein L31